MKLTTSTSSRLIRMLALTGFCLLLAGPYIAYGPEMGTIGDLEMQQDGNNIDCESNSNSKTTGVGSDQPLECNLISTSQLLITLQMIASPALINTGETVAFDYIVKQTTALIALVDVQVSDDKCSPVHPVNNGDFNAGDLNQDHVLNGNEEWRFSCAMTINEDTTNTATVRAKVQLLGIAVQNSAQATVDVRPTIAVNKSAIPNSVPESGGDVMFTVAVTNHSREAVTLRLLTDSTFGNLDGQGACKLNQALAASGGVYTCSFTKFISGDASGPAHENIAQAVVADEEGNEASAQDSASVHFDNVTPVIQINKTAEPGERFEPGGAFSYTLSIINMGGEAVRIVQLTDDHPLSLECLALVGALLSPNQQATCTYTLNHVAPGVYNNTAHVTVRDDDNLTFSTTATADVRIHDVQSSIKVAKTANPAVLSGPGGKVNFTVVVKNTSSTDTVTLLSLDDDLNADGKPEVTYAAADICARIVLAPAEETTCSFVLNLTGAAGDVQIDTVTVNAIDDDGEGVTGAAQAQVTLTGAQILATKRDLLLDDRNGDNVANPGDAIRYRIVITNTGNTPANVTFADTVDTNTTVIPNSTTTSQGAVSHTPTTVTAQLGALAPANTATIQFDVRIADTLAAGVSSIANQGSVSIDPAGLVLTDDPDTDATADPTRTNVMAQPVLAVTKADRLVVDADQSGSAGPGDTLEYNLTITNVGNARARDVRLEDSPDPYTPLVAGSVTTSHGSITKGNGANDKTVIVHIEDLLPKQSAVVRFQVTIAQPLPGGVTQVENQAVVRSEETLPVVSDDPDTRAVDDATTTLVVATPVLTAFKSDSLAVDADGDGRPSAGDTVRYEIVVTNTGDQTASAVMLHDTPDPITTLIASSVNTDRGAVMTGNNAGDATIVIALSDLAPGDEATVIFEVRIVEPLSQNVVRISNQAQISAANSETVLSDDPATPVHGDPTQTIVADAPVIEMTKRDLLYIDADEDNAVSAGDTLIYVIKLSNVGNAAAVDVTLEDLPDPHTALQNGSVQASQGIVLVGNAAGDAEVTIALGDLAPGATADVGFHVYVENSEQGAISNQAVARFGSPNDDTPLPDAVVSDDPDTPARDDPTVTPVRQTVSGAGENSLYLPLIDK